MRRGGDAAAGVEHADEADLSSACFCCDELVDLGFSDGTGPSTELCLVWVEFFQFNICCLYLTRSIN